MMLVIIWASILSLLGPTGLSLYGFRGGGLRMVSG